MNQNQMLAALAVTAWLFFHMGRNSAAAAAKPATAVATVDSATWDWLNAVGRM